MKNTRAEKPLPKNRPSKRVGSGTLVSPLSPSRSRIDQAKRYALQNFDQWNEVTGFVQPHCGYYGEITSLIRDAVEFGFGVAHGQTWRAIRRRLKAEEDAETKACVIEAGANAEVSHDPPNHYEPKSTEPDHDEESNARSRTGAGRCLQPLC